MGNGQCPSCCGVPESWLGHTLHLDNTNLGHKKDCEHAAMMVENGLNPLYIGESKLTDVYENYITKQGFFATRLKTKNGCPKINKIIEEYTKK